jgi:hypothetical protein
VGRSARRVDVLEGAIDRRLLPGSPLPSQALRHSDFDPAAEMEVAVRDPAGQCAEVGQEVHNEEPH